MISSTGDESVEELVSDCEPHIILLDIMLLNKSGYEVCRTLRDKGLADHTVIIFISSLNSLQDKLKAYEAGGDDYICKPVDLAELEYKLEAYQKRIHQHRQLETKVEEASQVAYTSMLQSKELAILLNFFRSTQEINDLDSLYQAVKSAVLQLNIGCVIEFRTNKGCYQYPQDHVSQLELEILDLGKRAKRIVTFGKNVLFNTKQCSLLVKNLPIENEALGRVRDLLAMLLELIDSRLHYIQDEQSTLENRRTTLAQLQNEITASLQHCRESAAEKEQKVQQKFIKLTETLQQELSHAQISDTLSQKIQQILDVDHKEIKAGIEISAILEYKIRDIEKIFNQIK